MTNKQIFKIIEAFSERIEEGMAEVGDDINADLARTLIDKTFINAHELHKKVSAIDTDALEESNDPEDLQTILAFLNANVMIGALAFLIAKKALVSVEQEDWALLAGAMLATFGFKAIRLTDKDPVLTASSHEFPDCLPGGGPVGEGD